MLVPFRFLHLFRILSLSLKFSRLQMIVLGWFFFAIFCFFALWPLSMIILPSMSSFSLKSLSASASQLSPTFPLIPSILRLFLLERSSKSTNLLWTNSRSSYHSYIFRIRSSSSSAFSWHFKLFPLAHSQWILCSSKFHKAIRFSFYRFNFFDCDFDILIVRLSKFFCCSFLNIPSD